MKSSLMVSLILLSLFLVCGCQPKEQYVRYCNERFGFCVDYPASMKLDPLPENGDGFSCQSNTMRLAAWGSMNIEPYSFAPASIGRVAEMNAMPTDTMSKIEGGTFCHSGIDSLCWVYYGQYMLQSGTDNGNVVLVLRLSWPKHAADSLKPVMEHIVASFK